ncbi:hypothetical protein OH492_11315 [Vibrio chagasii]|nr:hypothetical protein [Vibrio chagasii]
MSLLFLQFAGMKYSVSVAAMAPSSVRITMHPGENTQRTFIEQTALYRAKQTVETKSAPSNEIVKVVPSQFKPGTIQ